MKFRTYQPLRTETPSPFPLSLRFEDTNQPACALVVVGDDGSIGLLAGTFNTQAEVTYPAAVTDVALAVTSKVVQPFEPGLYLAIGAGITTPLELIADAAISPPVPPSASRVYVSRTRYSAIETMHLYIPPDPDKTRALGM